MTAEKAAELRVLRWRRNSFWERQLQVLLIVVLCWLHNQTPWLWPWAVATVALQAIDAIVSGRLLANPDDARTIRLSILTRVASALGFAACSFLFLLDGSLFGVIAAVFVSCANSLNNAIMTRGSWRGTATMVIPSAFVLVAIPWVALMFGAPVTLGDALLMMLGAFAYVGFVWRLTQILNKESRLVESALAEAEEAGRAKDRFLANMSHEIRTPLNGVVGIAHALGNTPLTPGQREMVQLINSSSLVLERLLSDALDSAKIAAGSFSLETSIFDLRHEIEGAALLLRPRAEEKGLRFSLNFAEGIDGLVSGDPVRLRQIISNLVANAVKFTSEGEVRVSVSVARDPAKPQAERLVIDVRDNGIGFDARTAANLFQPFAQADATITRRFGGSGLGLWIARSLAVAMDGTLTAESTPGRGSTFTLTLPLRRAAAPARQTAAAAAQPATARDLHLRILLAEDHPTNQRVVTLLLEPLGASVTVVDNGQLALEAWQAGRFDLVLMDMQMPVMDGLTAIAHIRAREAEQGRPRTPIAMITANAMAGHREASTAAGADAHITKPITSAGLITGIERALESATQSPAWPVLVA